MKYDTTCTKKAKMELALGSPSVRLVANANQGREESKAQAFAAPDLRLALGAGFDVNYDPQKGFIGKALASPQVRLAHVPGAQGDNCLVGRNGMAKCLEAPALLVSYFYLEPFEKNKHNYVYRDWVLDSGAFSAHNSGAVIDLNKYIDKCLELMGSDPGLAEIFALDVIPKEHKPVVVAKAAEQSLKNTEEMWRQGVPAIPCFHRGEPEEFLYAMAKTYPKLAIGGVALERGDSKFDFCEQVFARVWPKKIHGFGMSSEDLVYGLPFHSVDATNWEIAPCAFGNWVKFGQMSVRGSSQDLRSQVKHYLSMEAKARVRWEKEMAQLEALAPSPSKLGAPTGRLAHKETGRPQKLSPEQKSQQQTPAPATAGQLDDKWRKAWWL